MVITGRRLKLKADQSGTSAGQPVQVSPKRHARCKEIVRVLSSVPLLVY